MKTLKYVYCVSGTKHNKEEALNIFKSLNMDSSKEYAILKGDGLHWEFYELIEKEVD